FFSLGKVVSPGVVPIRAGPSRCPDGGVTCFLGSGLVAQGATALQRLSVGAVERVARQLPQGAQHAPVVFQALLDEGAVEAVEVPGATGAVQYPQPGIQAVLVAGGLLRAA